MMQDNRYSLATAGKYLHLTTSAVQYRARKLGINAASGITADDVRAIAEFERIRAQAPRRRRSTLADLMEEMEGKNHE